MSASVDEKARSGKKLRGGEPLLEQLVQLVDDAESRSATNAALRTLTGPLLGSLATMRHEEIEPYERALRYVSLRLSSEVSKEGGYITHDVRYLLGRAEALLEIVHMGIDRSISTKLVQLASKRKYVPEVLGYLVAKGDMMAADIREASRIPSKQQLWNTLEWMEQHELVRRVAVGRNCLVSLGPKGEAVHNAILEARHSWQPEGLSYLIDSARAHERGDLNTAAKLAQDGLEVVRNSQGTSDLEIELLYRLAEVEHDIRNVAAALDWINLAIDLREADIRENGDTVRAESRVPTAQLYRCRATIYVIQGKWREADTDYARSLSLADDDMPAVRARIINSQCATYIRREDFPKAEIACNESQRLWKIAESRNPDGAERNLAYSYSHLAKLKLSVKRSYSSFGSEVIGNVRSDIATRRQEVDISITNAILGFHGDDRNEAEAKLLLASYRSRFCNEHEQALSIAEAALAYGVNTELDLPQVRAHRVMAGIHLNALLDIASSDTVDMVKLKSHLESCDQHLNASSIHAAAIEDIFETALIWRLQGIAVSIWAELKNDVNLRKAADELLKLANDCFQRMGLPREIAKTDAILKRFQIISDIRVHENVSV